MNIHVLLCISSLSLFSGCASSKKNIKKKAPIVQSEKIISLRNKSAKKFFLQGDQIDKKVDQKDDVNVPEASGTLVNRIVCRVNGSNIMHASLNKPRIDRNGAFYSLDELIAEELLWQKASELKSIPSSTEIEQRIISIKQAHGMLDASEEEFAAWLKQESQLTHQELQRQLLRIGASSQVKLWNAQESSVVSEKEKENYYEAHKSKSKEDATTHVKVVFKESISDASSVDIDSDEWIDIGWVKQSELAPAMASIVDLKKGDISSPFKTEQGYQVVLCLDKKEERIKTYEESSVDIEKKLIYKKQKKADKKLIEKLRDRASIIMLEK
ncbi:peptidylprolyl isomerase [Candidatus Babeliales bacterium]|nr:peptidylprolyl isomerase [Candidatus Babeliales bacterium]